MVDHGRIGVMTSYRERLWPSAWMYGVIALVVPATLLVFSPIDLIVGGIVALVLAAGSTALLLTSAPEIAVGDGMLRAGRASIPVALTGEAIVARGDDARHEKGPGGDARAWLMLRGWVEPVVRIAVLDPDDPAPYWLLSTRRPEELVAALRAERAATAA